jgi:hypothetical protein
LYLVVADVKTPEETMTVQETISDLAPRYRAMTRRKELAYKKAARSTYEGAIGSVYAGLGLSNRFTLAVQGIERSRRVAARFALHLERVERAFDTPVASYLRFLAEVA